MILNRPQIPEHLWGLPAAWRAPLVELHHILTTIDPHHLVPQVTTRKGRLRIHIVPSVPLGDDDGVNAALHNLMWQHVHSTEARILATPATTQGEHVSFLEEIHTELSNLWKAMEDKGSTFANLFKGVVDKVGGEVEAQAAAVAPTLEQDAKQDASEVLAAAEEAVATPKATPEPSPAPATAPAAEEAPAAASGAAGAPEAAPEATA